MTPRRLRRDVIHGRTPHAGDGRSANRNRILKQPHDQARRHALCALAHRLSAHRRGPHGAVQLALRAPHRRQVPAAHRGHRSRALHRARHRRPSSTGSSGSSSIGTASRSTSSPARSATARWPRSCWPPARPTAAICQPAESRLCTKHAAERELRKQEKRPLQGSYDPGPWRDRDPKDAPAGRQARDPPQGAARRRDRDRGPRAGPRRVAERRPRRHGHPAQRRHAGLQPRRRRRRSRHGHHARHPRRRPPHQRRPAGADLQGHGLGDARCSPTCR